MGVIELLSTDDAGEELALNQLRKILDSRVIHDDDAVEIGIPLERDRTAHVNGSISHFGHERHHFVSVACIGFLLIGIPVLDGSLDATNGELFLSDLEQTKGYEFDTLAVLNCAENILPPSGAPSEETFRFGCQLYVAMTRARDLLVLSHSGAPSKWLKHSSDVLTWGSWDNYVDIPDTKLIGRPGFLPEVPDSEDDTKAIMKLHGKGFGYTMYARGLSGEILDKLEELVPTSGRSRSRNGHRVRWNCVGQLFKDMQAAAKEKRPRHIFGPLADRAVLEALELANSGSRPLARRRTVNKIVNLKPLPKPKAA